MLAGCPKDGREEGAAPVRAAGEVRTGGDPEDATARGGGIGGMPAGFATASSGGAPAGCATGPLVGTPGKRRVALVVANETYLGRDRWGEPIPALPGTRADADAIRALLTGPDGYGFPPENVCVTRDLTVAGFAATWEAALARRDLRAGDEVLFYYSGHGAQEADADGDEWDRLDEALVMHDSYQAGVAGVRDDELYRRLDALPDGVRVTVVLDACNSGSATRAASSQGIVRAVSAPLPADAGGGARDRGAFEDQALPGLVVVSAAADGSSALELRGAGVLTRALVRVLAEAPATPLTWEQAWRRVRVLVKAESSQVVAVQGEVDREVFSGVTRKRPLSWEVAEVGSELTLTGVPMAGWSPGAEVRLYDPRLDAAGFADPKRAHARAELLSLSGPRASARLVLGDPARPVAAGDLAVLAQAGIDGHTVRARLRPAGQPGGVPTAVVSALQAELARDPVLTGVVRLGADGDWELSTAADGALEVRGPEGVVRRSFPAASGARSAVGLLGDFALQKALLSLPTQPGVFRDEDTLRVSLVPGKPVACARGWPSGPVTSTAPLTLPLCAEMLVRVSLAPGTKTPDGRDAELRVGGAALSIDGGVTGFSDTNGQRPFLVKAGTHADVLRLTGVPPLGALDHLVIVGTSPDEQVPWERLTTPTRGVEDELGPLGGAVSRYLSGTRGPGAAGKPRPDAFVWTATHVELSVRANPPRPPAFTGDPAIPAFSLLPYLPSASTAPLRRLLDATRLRSEGDKAAGGHRYAAHAWTSGSDAANLAAGIDAARAVALVYRDAGLAFPAPAALPTLAGWRDADALGRAGFSDCLGRPGAVGDVLVRADVSRGAAQVLLLVDPAEGVGWGTLGWDGPGGARSGLAYQWIRPEAEAGRLGLPVMKPLACWRSGVLETSVTRAGEGPGSYLAGRRSAWCADPRSCAGTAGP